MFRKRYLKLLVAKEPNLGTWLAESRRSIPIFSAKDDYFLKSELLSKSLN
jgi:hypothetical protein